MAIPASPRAFTAVSIELMRAIQPQVESEINYKFNLGYLAGQSVCAQTDAMNEDSVRGHRITLRLVVLGKTQGWLAEQLGISDNAVSKWISGKTRPRGKNLELAAKHLKCSQGYLTMDYEDDDIAAVVDMMQRTTKEKRRDIRKISAAHIEPEGQNGPNGKPKKEGGKRS